MRRLLAVTAAMAVTACGGAFSTRVDSVAHANDYTLGVQQLAEVIANGKDLPVRRQVVEGVSVLWVDYTLFVDHLLAGDSLLDSTHVAAAMWADIQQEIASRFHDKLIGEAAQLDSAAVDSAYAAGNYRLIRHIAYDVQPDAAPNVRAVKRRMAEDTRAKLMSGAKTWAEASAASDDPVSRAHEGDLGVIARGETNERFENVAFALAPGEISPVTETSRGYDIIFRPPLADVRAEFKDGIEAKIEDQFDSTYLQQLPERWDLRVRPGIGPAVREVGRDPVHAKESRKVIGSYRGGEFRVADLARWLQGMPPQVWRQLPGASDSQVAEIVMALMRNEVLLREARAAGIMVTPEYFTGVTDTLRRELSLLGAVLGVPNDSLASYRALAPAARHQLVETRVLDYLVATSQNKKRLQTVPPFLADQLRAEAKWKVVPAGVERVMERARELRLALDSVPGNRPGQPAAAPPVAPMTPAPPQAAPGDKVAPGGKDAH
jgi:hypothetical protein